MANRSKASTDKKFKSKNLGNDQNLENQQNMKIQSEENTKPKKLSKPKNERKTSSVSNETKEPKNYSERAGNDPSNK